MNKTQYLAGLALLGMALVGSWAALAPAQSDATKPVLEPPAPPAVPALNPVVAPPQGGPVIGAPLQVPVSVFNPPAAPNAPLTPAAPAGQVPGGVGANGLPVLPPFVAPASGPGPLPPPVAGPGVVPAPGVPRLPLGPGAAEEQDLGPGQDEKNPTGRQEPAISLEWIGPPVTKVGRPADYTLAVRNVCNGAVQHVLVRVRMPQGMNVTLTEPKAAAEGNVYVWELGTMMPKQEKNLQMRLVPDSRGNLGCQASVTFTGSSSMKIRVCEPKLVLKLQAAERVLIGDTTTFLVAVNNPGDGPADQVKISADLSSGLEHANGKKAMFDVGTLAPGETRTVQIACATKAGGPQSCDAVAVADGDLRAQDKANVNVMMPRLDVEVNGPKLRYLDRPATYTIKVTNPGDAPATNVQVSDLIPAGFKFVGAPEGGRHDFSTRTVAWFVGDLEPGKSKEVHLNVVAVNPGEHQHKVAAQAARGLKAENELTTRVEGLSALLLEVVDTQDPIEVGADTSYEIRVTNTGTKTETDIRLACTIPDQMQFKGAQGPARFQEQGKVIAFEPLPKLAPRADAIFRIFVKATAPANVRFRTQLNSTNLQEPVVEQEATRIYQD